MKSSGLVLILLLFTACDKADHRESIGLKNKSDAYDAKSYDNFIRNSMRDDWVHLERRRWVIEYKDSQWYISGTIWRADVVNIIGMEKLDKGKRYDFRGVALDQNYGRISIYNDDQAMHEMP